MAKRTRGVDAMAMPTVTEIAPTLAELTSYDDYGCVNLFMSAIAALPICWVGAQFPCLVTAKDRRRSV